MLVDIDNRQKAWPLDLDELTAKVLLVMEKAGCAPDAELSLVIMGDDEIAGLNREYLGRPGPTNVLAFSQVEGEGPGRPHGLLGDVVVSADTARREADEDGLDPDAHLMRLVIHGLLHLLGFDHLGEAAQARRMEEFTEDLLEAALAG